MDLSIVIPTYKEAENVKGLLRGINLVVSKLIDDYEIIVVDSGSMDGTEKYAKEEGAVFCMQKLPGYGNALKEGFQMAKGKYVLTMDADFSHEPVYIKDLWNCRDKAELVVASRFVVGGKADMPWGRKVLSVFLNKVYTWVLSLPYKDISSGFRMYKKDVLREVKLDFSGFSMLQELLSKIHCGGYRIVEVPFYYKPRRHGKSSVRLFKMAFSYLSTLFSMWKLRNSLESADYDERAYNSRILPQRCWQRSRYNIVKNMIEDEEKLLDIGCGTSKIIQSLPKAVGMDVNHNVLRYLRKNRNLLAEASIRDLPFKDDCFRTVICSELIEHIPKEYFRMDEIERVLTKDGVFILGTPDYGRRWWCFVEWVYKKIIPGGYGDQHISHYSADGLEVMLKKRGWNILDKKYVLAGEVIFKLKRA